jgi:hypothetical protein
MEALSEDAPHTLLWEGPAEPLGKAIARAATFTKEAISSVGAKEVLGIAAAAYAFHRLILTRPKLDLQGTLHSPPAPLPLLYTSCSQQRLPPLSLAQSMVFFA